MSEVMYVHACVSALIYADLQVAGSQAGRSSQFCKPQTSTVLQQCSNMQNHALQTCADLQVLGSQQNCADAVLCYLMNSQHVSACFC